nr:hypothetical protein [Pirellula sp.]
MHKKLPIDASDADIRAIVVEWSEQIADGKFDVALSLFPSADPINSTELEYWIENYGSPDPYPDGRKYKLTSIMDQPNAEEFVEKSIDVDRQNLYGLDPSKYVGMVHYDNVPLNGQPSDLTARFHIQRL